jgi:hypothetical protein
MNEALKNRLKSFVWRLGMMLLAVVVDFTLKNLTALDLGANTTVVLGLLLGEVSKYLNKK